MTTNAMPERLRHVLEEFQQRLDAAGGRADAYDGDIDVRGRGDARGSGAVDPWSGHLTPGRHLLLCPIAPGLAAHAAIRSTASVISVSTPQARSSAARAGSFTVHVTTCRPASWNSPMRARVSRVCLMAIAMQPRRAVHCASRPGHLRRARRAADREPRRARHRAPLRKTTTGAAACVRRTRARRVECHRRAGFALAAARRLDLDVDGDVVRAAPAGDGGERGQRLAGVRGRMPAPRVELRQLAPRQRVGAAAAHWSCGRACRRAAGTRRRPPKASRRTRPSGSRARSRRETPPACSRARACRRRGARKDADKARRSLRRFGVGGVIQTPPTPNSGRRGHVGRLSSGARRSWNRTRTRAQDRR